MAINGLNKTNPKHVKKKMFHKYIIPKSFIKEMGIDLQFKE